jgi:benzoate/toluate 1,2-dioxygenase reductase component
MTDYTLEVTGHRWLTDRTFEIRFRRPPDFQFLPGQKVRFVDGNLERDYTLLGPRGVAELAICVRHIPEGRFSPRLAESKVGDLFQVTPPFGYFTFNISPRRAVFIATGTGIAPFVAFVRDGVHDFDLLHGVRSAEELYYYQELESAARKYIPCLSNAIEFPAGMWPLAFSGHVGQGLQALLPSGAYDFYLCGRGDMIRDVMGIIDERYEGSHVFNEIFY